MLHDECFDAFGSEAAEPLAATDACPPQTQTRTSIFKARRHWVQTSIFGLPFCGKWCRAKSLNRHHGVAIMWDFRKILSGHIFTCFVWGVFLAARKTVSECLCSRLPPWMNPGEKSIFGAIANSCKPFAAQWDMILKLLKLKLRLAQGYEDLRVTPRRSWLLSLIGDFSSSTVVSWKSI